MLWNEISARLELKNFQDGVNDARRRSVDPIAYQVNPEYKKGVDIARQLIANLEAVRDRTPEKSAERLA
jgi:hypothetical protein